MALNNRRRATSRHLALGLADPQIVVPGTAYAEATETNRRSLVGRVLGPRKPDLYSVIQTLPHEWNAAGSRSRGRVIGGGKFQFVFERDRDLEMVLWSGPYTHNGWLVVLQQWEDEPGPEFLQSVPMWLRIRGIPIRYVCEGTIREIVSSMGEVMEIDLDDKTVDLRSVRVRVNVSVDTKLCFKKVVRFESGETKIVKLRYEDVAWNTSRFRFCRNCGDLNHLAKSCSHVWVDVPDPLERALSPPPPDASFDGSAENNGGNGTLTWEEKLEQVDGSSDAVQDLPDGDLEQKQQGLDGVQEADDKQVKSEIGGTSSEGSKRKFEAVEEADDILEKRIRGSSDATEGLGVNLKPLGEE
ncbi:hypothetical protein EUTSA_v10002589mg [Eutrema salsugineum]|uniref:DUF4283 domain-containing protein n=1 Tax=Eutrema salsugineum TaxID=72664 RepID=V4LBU1_EUTSA|nr:uncharacterized protein LOC18013849 [Eutrema salsugineum]ESQ37233.1 hypothetical protein EUTSA_v10002589mg [Eutrema salsugineum]